MLIYPPRLKVFSIIFVYCFKKKEYLFLLNGMHKLKAGSGFHSQVNQMLEHLRQERFQQGRRDRDAGLLPRMQESSYLEGYLKGRPEGLDSTVQYFTSIEEYLLWKQRR